MKKRCFGCKKPISRRSRSCRSCWQLGKNNSAYKGGGNCNCMDCGKKVHYKTRCWECFKKWNHGSNHHSWRGGPKKCIDCGIELVTRSSSVKRCRACNTKWYRGENHKDWKGQRGNGKGYIVITINSKSVLEHRLIVEQHLNRKLQSHEIVHHLNGVRDDNRIENLALTTRPEHEHNTFVKQLQMRIKQLELQLTALEQLPSPLC